MTSLERLRGIALQYWRSGRVLRAWLGKDPLFPLAIPLDPPASAGEATRRWKRSLEGGCRCHAGQGYRIQYVETEIPGLAAERLPAEAVFDEAGDLIAFIGRTADLRSFAELSGTIRGRYPELRPWIEDHPIQVLRRSEDWPGLLDALDLALGRRTRPVGPGPRKEGANDPDPADLDRRLLGELRRCVELPDDGKLPR